MTKIQRYTFLMNCLLLSLPAQGFLWILFLFAFSFFCVILIRLALLGANANRETPPEHTDKKEEKKAPAQPQEPIYYIVEKKTRRPKSSYSEPKQINFK